VGQEYGGLCYRTEKALMDSDREHGDEILDGILGIVAFDPKALHAGYDERQ